MQSCGYGAVDVDVDVTVTVDAPSFGRARGRGGGGGGGRASPEGVAVDGFARRRQWPGARRGSHPNLRLRVNLGSHLGASVAAKAPRCGGKAAAAATTIAPSMLPGLRAAAV